MSNRAFYIIVGILLSMIIIGGVHDFSSKHPTLAIIIIIPVVIICFFLYLRIRQYRKVGV